MAADEAKTTNSVSIYYASVNVDGIQYSARMVVKKLRNHGVVLGDLSMYNMAMHKEKTPTNTGLNSPQNGLGSYSAGVSGYKVKDLIHSTQENDQKLLGITDINGLRFSKVGSPKPENTSPDIVEALKNAGLDVRTYDNTGTEDQKDANRTQATMDAVQGRNDIMFQMVGKEGAAEADRAEGNDERSRNLALAEDSEKAGVDARAVKLATGWERGADGQWRYEIPDADVDILSKYKAKADEMKKDGVAKPQPIIKLGELFGEDSELFKYYPDLKKTDVLFSDTLPDGTAGSFDGTNIELNAKELNRFDVDDLNNENVYGTLLHEVQHAIQEKEGFALGGNLQTSTTEDGINAIIEKKERRRADIKTRLDANNKILSDPENLKMSAELEGKTEKEVRDQLAETVDQQAAEYDTLGLQIERLRHTKAPSMTDARDLYHRLAGEVEARNVTERMGMTGEQRRQSLASETEDVSREDQVIINGEGGVLSFTDSNEEFDHVRDKC